MKVMRKKIVIVNAKRFTLFCMTLVLSVISAAVVATNAYTSTSVALANERVSTITVYVRSGDTLWDIAKANNPRKIDVRDLIYEIKEYNNMKTSNIQVGDEIVVPII